MGAVTDEVGPMEQHSIKVIARIRSDFKTKFGVPRQSGLVEALRARIVFEPEYRNADALRGIEGFSHLWLIWQFSETVREDWSPTVRPPRLGGNERMGVFATRSPFRPNAIGLSCVRLDGVEQTAEGSVLLVSGADLMDGTPIYDIKPYLPYADCKPEASGGFAPQRGSICMDMCMIDLTELPEVDVGSEVELFGERNSIYKLSDAAGTIPYELLCAVSKRVPRVYVRK